MVYPNALPNITHEVLAKLEQQGKLSCIITQNIDGLHQKAGSQKVIELHGSVLRNYCMDCHTFYDVHKVLDSEIPYCECGGLIKPDVVLYEEGLDNEVIQGAINAIRSADMLVIGGTSLVVYPAAGFIDYFRGNRLVVLNKSATARDVDADLCIQEPIGEVLGRIRV
jgi:NAD-dependent deacetylase